MTSVTPFKFQESTEVRTVTDDGGEVLFVGKDVCKALGYSNHNDAMNDHCRGVAKRYPILDSLGRTQEARVLTEADVLRLIVNSKLPAAEAFERWVFEEVLPSIRKTGSYIQVKHAALPSRAVPEFKALFELAQLIGCDTNAASISANQGTLAVTGLNLLALMGLNSLPSPEQAVFYTPTELGKQCDPVKSAVKVNQVLEAAGLQHKPAGHWEPTDAGKAHSRVFDTGKRHNSGTPVQQVKWSQKVLALAGLQP